MTLVWVLDDYQHVALESADWTPLPAEFEVRVSAEHIAGEDELVDLLAEATVVVAMRERTAFPRSLLERLPALRLLITTGMSNAAIDVPAARELGVTVCGTGGAGNAMPELTLGMIIALTRNFAQEDAAVRAGGWQHTIGPGLSGSTLGVVGLGRLGTPVARLAQAFGMTVIAWSPHLTQQRCEALQVRAVDKESLFRDSDVVTVHMPLTPATRGLIGAPELALMKSTAYLVNTSRGPLVSEPALVAALRTRRIAGAGLDVYDVEPLPLTHPLRSLRNTLLLPHIGYVTREAYRAFYGGVVEDIVAWSAGEPIRTV